jgi:hypothetical protein
MLIQRTRLDVVLIVNEGSIGIVLTLGLELLDFLRSAHRATTLLVVFRQVVVSVEDGRVVLMAA